MISSAFTARDVTVSWRADSTGASACANTRDETGTRIVSLSELHNSLLRTSSTKRTTHRRAHASKTIQFNNQGENYEH
jgi:hypothetical protein